MFHKVRNSVPLPVNDEESLKRLQKLQKVISAQCKSIWTVISVLEVHYIIISSLLSSLVMYSNYSCSSLLFSQNIPGPTPAHIWKAKEEGCVRKGTRTIRIR